MVAAAQEGPGFRRMRLQNARVRCVRWTARGYRATRTGAALDWYVEPGKIDAVPDLRHAVRRYLERHAEPGGDVDGAEVVFSEILTNALRHASGPAWVTLDWSAARPVLTVRDLGPGFDLDRVSRVPPSASGGVGLRIVSHLTDELRVATRAAGGAEVTATLPVRRDVERSFDPPRHGTAMLPALEEANERGEFDKVSFLRALVVQLAQTVDAEHGPSAAEAAVAQVGIDVGGQIEEAYRRARGVTERLTPEQMGDLYVRLKRAIEGDFFVIEANEERVVLGNRACPFGPVVRYAPALCRMTSSVFGGIAARNRGAAAVQLEERIAVGDPECRVTVWLGEPPASARDVSHLYADDAGQVGDRARL
jgi:anti-sigma regulatory factor (Ser/Thr protein kinase)/predicted ArsR family transcriptional regulator